MSRVPLVLLGLLVAHAPAAYGFVSMPPGFSPEIISIASGLCVNIHDLSTASLPVSGTVQCSLSGSSDTTNFDFSDGAFRITFDQTHPGGLLDEDQPASAVSITRVWIHADADVDYSLDGVYTTVDPDGERTDFEVFIRENFGSGHAYLFHSFQRSTATPNESFTLGQNTGDDPGSFVSGSLTGKLLAGHNYEFYASVFNIEEWPENGPNPVTASGHVTLTFIPEPSTGLLLALGLVGLCRLRLQADSAGHAGPEMGTAGGRTAPVSGTS